MGGNCPEASGAAMLGASLANHCAESPKSAVVSQTPSVLKEVDALLGLLGQYQ